MGHSVKRRQINKTSLRHGQSENSIKKFLSLKEKENFKRFKVFDFRTESTNNEVEIYYGRKINSRNK